MAAMLSFLLSVTAFFVGSYASPRPGTSAPVSQEYTILTPQFFPDHSPQRVKLNYGPYTVPAMYINNGMKAFQNRSVGMPCTDCLVTWIQAGLEYPDGTAANIDTGMWLHHTVFSNTARISMVCPSKGSGDRFFASGNERTAADICNSGTENVGYYIAPGDNFAMVAELMNLKDEARDVILTMTYEYIPGLPAGFDKVRSMWLDIGGCRGSELPAEPNAVFQYSSPPFKSNSTGRITSFFSHLHDGGQHIEIQKNGDAVCDAKAEYQNFDTSSFAETENVHISSISKCDGLGTVSPGDEWTITAYYNTALHTPMKNTDGSLEPIMGISLAYIAEPSEPTRPHYVGRTIAIVLSCIAIVTVLLALVWARRQGHSVKDVVSLFRREGRIFVSDSDQRMGLPLLSGED